MFDRPKTKEELAARSRLMMLIIFLTGTMGMFASDIYLPSLPAITQNFNTDEHLVQLTISIYLTTFGVSSLVYGPLSDRFGRRNILLVGIAISLIGTILCVIAGSIHALLIGRLVQGVGIGAATSFRAILRDCFEGQTLARYSAKLSLYVALTPIIAPLSGGIIQTHLGWRYVFITLFIMHLFIWMIVYLYLPETHDLQQGKTQTLKSTFQNFKTLLTNQHYLVYVTCSGCAMSAFIVYASISPFLFQSILGLTPIQYGSLAIIEGIAFGSGAHWNHRLSHQYSSHRIAFIGARLFLISSIVMLLIGLTGTLNLWVVLVPFTVIVFGLGLIFANVFALAMTPFPKMAGIAGSLYGCLQSSIASFISLFAAAVHETNQIPFASVLFLTAIVQVTALWYIHRAEK